MGDKAYHSNLRVDGFVQPGSIEQNGTHVDFVLNEFESHSPKAAGGRLLKVSYKGSEPPPDTFKDDAAGAGHGTYGRDGVFHATNSRPSAPASTRPRSPAQRRPLRPQQSRPLHRRARRHAPSPTTQTAAN